MVEEDEEKIYISSTFNPMCLLIQRTMYYDGYLLACQTITAALAVQRSWQKILKPLASDHRSRRIWNVLDKKCVRKHVGYPICVMVDDSNVDRIIRRGIVEGLTIIIDLGTETRIDEKFFTILALEEHMADSSSKKSVANVIYGGESLEYDDGFKLVFVTQSKLSSDESCSQHLFCLGCLLRPLKKSYYLLYHMKFCLKTRK